MSISAIAERSAPRSASRVNPNAVLAVVAVTQFMVILDASVVNVARRTIKHELGFSEQSVSWVLNACALVFGGSLLLAGGSRTGSGRGGCSSPGRRCSPARRSAWRFCPRSRPAA
jgi:MFS family permease